MVDFDGKIYRFAFTFHTHNIRIRIRYCTQQRTYHMKSVSFVRRTMWNKIQRREKKRKIENRALAARMGQVRCLGLWRCTALSILYEYAIDLHGIESIAWNVFICYRIVRNGCECSYSSQCLNSRYNVRLCTWCTPSCSPSCSSYRPLMCVHEQEHVFLSFFIWRMESIVRNGVYLCDVCIIIYFHSPTYPYCDWIKWKFTYTRPFRI